MHKNCAETTIFEQPYDNSHEISSKILAQILPYNYDSI